MILEGSNPQRKRDETIINGKTKQDDAETAQ
jgi:hypothetical protein